MQMRKMPTPMEHQKPNITKTMPALQKQQLAKKTKRNKLKK